MDLIIQSTFHWATKNVWFNPFLIKLYPNEYSHEFHYYPFPVKLDRCVESCNTLNDSSKKACISNKTKELNLRVFNMITKINKLITLTKHISWECKCRFDDRKYNADQWWNNDKCRCEYKNVMYVKKIMFGILLHVIVKMENI